MGLKNSLDPQRLHPSQTALAEALPQIVWSARPDGTVDWISHEFERYTGISDSDFAAGDWLLALHPDDRAPTLEIWGKSIARGQPYRTEFRVWSAAQERWCRHLVDARPHLDEAGEITRWFGLTIDIQDLRDAEEARESELRLQIVERRVLEQIAAGDPLSSVLTDICTAMSEVIRDCYAAIALVAEDGRHLDPCFSSANMGEWTRAIGQIPIGDQFGSCGAAVFRQESVFTSDIAHDPLWVSYRDLAAEHSLGACWSLPILDLEGQPIACFACYHSEPQAPTKAQRALLQRVAEAVRTSIAQVASRDQLRASEHQYRTLFNLAPIAIWEFDASGVLKMLDALRVAGITNFETWLDQHPAATTDALAKLRVLDTNDTARRLHGVEGDNPALMSAALLSLKDEPKFRGAMRAALTAAWEGNTDLETAYSIPRTDGTKTDVLVRHFLAEPDGSRLLMTELDITEQRRVEERFRHVAQASSDYIFDNNIATGTIWINDAASWLDDYNEGPCEVPRKRWVDSVHPDDREAMLIQIEAAISGGQKSWEGEYRFRLKNGEYIPVAERASILRDDTGEPVRLIGNIINLSEQKTLEAQLSQSQRLDAVGQLTGGIAHDFNNLLTVILGNAEILVDILPTNQPSATMAQQIVTASERAADLTQRLLAFARKQPLSPGTFDTNAIITDMQMLIERSMTPAITLNLDLAENLSAVRVDRSMFESALLNLCVNARDAMPAGGSLSIKTFASLVVDSTDPDMPKAGKYVHIAVSDTGDGMDDDTLARAIEPFFTTKPPGQGSGLGLSMVHVFVHQSGGHLRIHSDKGTGTTLELMLPRHNQPAGEDPEVETGLPNTIPRGRILVVEDEEQVREYLCMLIHSLGYEVEAEPHAAAALTRLREGEPFDLVLTDVVMPGGMSGRQLAETLLDEKQDLPVLLVSGHAEDILETDGKLDPRISFLRKPFRKAELERRLADMLPG